MSAHIDKDGNLIITIKMDKHFNPAEELERRRQSLYNAIEEHNNSDFIQSEVPAGLVEWLRDTEPSTDQWRDLLKK